jgi:hypothetical protein
MTMPHRKGDQAPYKLSSMTSASGVPLLPVGPVMLVENVLWVLTARKNNGKCLAAARKLRASPHIVTRHTPTGTYSYPSSHYRPNQTIDAISLIAFLVSSVYRDRASAAQKPFTRIHNDVGNA